MGRQHKLPPTLLPLCSIFQSHLQEVEKETSDF